MNNEITELLWKCGINENKHTTYTDIIEICLDSIIKISTLFAGRIGGDVNYELKIKAEDTISLDAGPMWGLHLIIFQVKFIVELIQLYEKLYDFDVEISLTPQRQRRLVLAVCLAFCHELAHIIRGHDSTVINEKSPNNRGSKAAEADADFLAGMQLHKFFTGFGIGAALQRNIDLKNDIFRLPVFFKDAGFCTVFLAFFLHNKLNPISDKYHLPNVRSSILLAGILYGVKSPPQEHAPYVKFLMAGHNEIIQYLENGVRGCFDKNEVKKFLRSCSQEEKELLEETSKEMDDQRILADNNSEVWKVLYEKVKKDN
jgi:hypothetical protein